ncbi:MAG: PAS domain-containing protein [Betaproteobacteria bacterium]|nr:PAS domain-containing protein [Betaproteobacteria bacterium]
MPPAALPGLAPDTAQSLWRSLRYFNLYRLAVASVFIAIFLVTEGVLDPGSRRPDMFLAVAGGYWLVALLFWAIADRPRLRFETWLTMQVVVDVAALTLLMHASGGFRSGIPFMLLVVLAGAGLVGQGRAALFYAALATLGLLLEQGYRSLAMGADAGEFLQVGVTSIGFFATAASTRMLASRVIANERLARQRGIDLANQLRINQQVILDMQDGVLVVDAAGRVRQHNPRAQTLLGVVPPEVAELAAYSPVLAQLAQPAARSGSGNVVTTFLAPGSGRTLQARFVPAGERGDQLVYLEDLDRAQSRAQQLKLAALGRLTASIAHEIRNPLSAISHAAQLLREEKRGDMQARLTRIIDDNSRRLERMVKDVLDLGRRDRVEPEVLALDAFLPAFVEDFCLHQRVARENFAVDVAPGTTLVFDRAHIHQVLWNLLDNALRHGSGAAGAIRLRAAPFGAARAQLRVGDDGPGIPEAARAQVFEPFYTTASKGTGLGLYIARELCEANGAALDVMPNDPGAQLRLVGPATVEGKS